jgi:hypothetical protein
MGGACSLHGEMRNACRILVEKYERKRSLGDKDNMGGYTNTYNEMT